VQEDSIAKTATAAQTAVGEKDLSAGFSAFDSDNSSGKGVAEMPSTDEDEVVDMRSHSQTIHYRHHWSTASLRRLVFDSAVCNRDFN